MNKLTVPYKITRTDTGGNYIVIKGRTLGLYSMAPLIFLPVAITALLLYRPQHFLIYVAICLGLFLVQPYICRFSIAISPSFVIVTMKYFGITIKRIKVPFQKVLIRENGFRDINEAFYDDYSHNPNDYLALEFDNRWDGPVDYVALCFKGKEFAFNAWQASFEAELWEQLTAAIRETYAQAQTK